MHPTAGRDEGTAAPAVPGDPRLSPCPGPQVMNPSLWTEPSSCPHIMVSSPPNVREGSILKVEGDQAKLLGQFPARWYHAQPIARILLSHILNKDDHSCQMSSEQPVLFYCRHFCSAPVWRTRESSGSNTLVSSVVWWQKVKIVLPASLWPVLSVYSILFNTFQYYSILFNTFQYYSILFKTIHAAHSTQHPDRPLSGDSCRIGTVTIPDRKLAKSLILLI